MSETDPLTGLHNLRYINARLQEALAEFHRGGQPFCVIMLDIDFFKAVNDQWGHPAGDRVLKQFAQRLREETRKSDTLARIGGEEFLIMLNDVNLQQAALIAEGLRAHIAATPFDLGNRNSQRITASIGICQTSAAIRDVSQLFAHVDLALYQAKSQGRDRVEQFVQAVSGAPTPS